MANNITIRDSSGAIRTMKAIEIDGVHTPYQMVGSVEKKFRDSFSGASLDTNKWDSSVGTGGSITTSAGQLVMASGTTANSESWILTKETFQVPFRISFHVNLSQRIANQTFFVEAVSVDPVTGIPNGISSCGWFFDGTVNTNARYRVQNGGITPLDSALVTVPITTGASIYEIEPFADECWFHGGTLDAVTGRANSYRRHQQIPDPNSVYKIRLRWLNGATSPATNTNASLQFVAVQDYQELTAEITAGRGQTSAGQAIAAAVVSMPSLAISTMPSLTIGAMPASTVVRTLESLGTATALGALNANISQALLGAPGAAAVITAISAPTGIVLTPQVSYDGGTNWVATRFFDAVTETAIATLNTFAVGASFGVLTSDGATHVRVIATSWTSGSVTVRLSTSNAQGVVNLKSNATHNGTPGDYLQIVGATASTAAPTAVTSGNAVRLWATTSGALNIADGGSTLTVDAPVASPVFVRLSNGTAAVDTLPVAAVAQNNVFWNDSTTAQAISATVTGIARDTAVAAGTVHRYSQFNAVAWADQAGTLRIEMSNDNTTWRRATADTAVAANAVVSLSVPIVTRFYRAVYVNGAVAQTAFMLNTSFTAA